MQLDDNDSNPDVKMADIDENEEVVPLHLTLQEITIFILYLF
jgi:hypothetical protein